MIQTRRSSATIGPARKEFLAGAADLLMLASCGSSAGGEESESSRRAQTIEHKYGKTEISGRSKRELSLGYQEHHAIFALGVEPVAVRYWYGDKADVIFPWDEADGAGPEILDMPFGELNFEKIASVRPDLVLGVYSGITEKEYETLSEIAPTVVQSEEYVDFGAPWQDMTLTVGRALDREKKAGELVADRRKEV